MDQVLAVPMGLVLEQELLGLGHLRMEPLAHRRIGCFSSCDSRMLEMELELVLVAIQLERPVLELVQQVLEQRPVLEHQRVGPMVRVPTQLLHGRLERRLVLLPHRRIGCFSFCGSRMVEMEQRLVRVGRLQLGVPRRALEQLGLVQRHHHSLHSMLKRTQLGRMALEQIQERVQLGRELLHVLAQVPQVLVPKEQVRMELALMRKQKPPLALLAHLRTHCCVLQSLFPKCQRPRAPVRNTS